MVESLIKELKVGLYYTQVLSTWEGFWRPPMESSWIKPTTVVGGVFGSNLGLYSAAMYVDDICTCSKPQVVEIMSSYSSNSNAWMNGVD
jgi:hypothetical protein